MNQFCFAEMLECLVEPPGGLHRCFFCQASLTPGEQYLHHMRLHLARYNTNQPLLATTAAAESPPVDRAVRVRRFRKRRLKPAAVKAVKKEEEADEEEEGSGGGRSYAVSDSDCPGDSELSDSDSDSCQQQTDKVRRLILIVSSNF